jgi:hypothetical protein
MVVLHTLHVYCGMSSAGSFVSACCLSLETIKYRPPPYSIVLFPESVDIFYDVLSIFSSCRTTIFVSYSGTFEAGNTLANWKLTLKYETGELLLKIHETKIV